MSDADTLTVAGSVAAECVRGSFVLADGAWRSACRCGVPLSLYFPSDCQWHVAHGEESDVLVRYTIYGDNRMSDDAATALVRFVTKLHT